MTNMKTTRRALFSSVVALVLCFTMLMGTTFAWFTDSVSSVGNTIQSGTLDVQLLDANEESLECKTLAFVDDEGNELTNILWEPGCRYLVEAFTVKNNGSLALKYKVVVTGATGDDTSLMSQIDWYVVTTTGDVALADYDFAETTLKAGETSASVQLKGVMKTTAGNEWQDKSVDGIAITVVATQATVEEDSFDREYDKNATLPNVTYVATAEELATALTSDATNINVILGADIDVPIGSLGTMTGGSGEYKLGGENTESITIDLSGNKLNITTTYWSNLGAKNDDATFTIKNGTMTSSQATGTWNSYDVTFSNCNYVIENVVFDKAVAFANAGKSVTMKNVTINETHDYYALWITAEGQTVTIDGLTVNSEGRGIKIDEQYVGTPAKVTLNVSNSTFTTAKKAAILVKSVAGADITVSNVDIANVAADTVNVVWNDADASAYNNLVTVTGGTKVQEQ